MHFLEIFRRFSSSWIRSSVGAAFATLCFSTGASAHPLDLALVRLTTEGNRISAEMDLHPRVVAELLGLAETELVPLTLQSRAEALTKRTLMAGEVWADETQCRWLPEIATPDFSAQRVRLAGKLACGEGPFAETLNWRFDLLGEPKLPKGFQVMVRLSTSDGERLVVADAAKPEVAIDVSPGIGFWGFVWSGMEHIGATPDQWYSDGEFHLPDGVDHILFVLALILGGGTLWALVGTATGFTVGHSITLALAATGTLRVPSRFVESLIALSIAFVAAEALLGKGARHRWKVAAAFGLVHGFGFAGALGDLGLTGWSLAKALVGFNLGVELGQVALVAILAPIVFQARRANWLKGYAVPACAVVVICAGGFWFVQRAFGL